MEDPATKRMKLSNRKDNHSDVVYHQRCYKNMEDPSLRSSSSLCHMEDTSDEDSDIVMNDHHHRHNDILEDSYKRPSLQLSYHRRSCGSVIPSSSSSSTRRKTMTTTSVALLASDDSGVTMTPSPTSTTSASSSSSSSLITQKHIAHLHPTKTKNCSSNSSSNTTRNGTLSSSSFMCIPSDVILDHIIPYIGVHQYRFVASINQCCYDNYTSYIRSFITSESVRSIPGNMDDISSHTKQKFMTYINGSTLEHTKICYTEMKHSNNNDGNDEKYEIVLCKLAALSGNVESIQYLHEKDCYWDHHSVCAAAARSGSLSVLQYLHDHGCPWDRKTICNDAVQSGNLHVLKYLRKHQCLWNHETSALAAKYGHIHIVQYLHKKNCPRDYETKLMAAECGHLDVYTYIRATGHDISRLYSAAQYGHLHLLQHYRHDIKSFDEFIGAAEHGQLHILQWWIDEFGIIELPTTLSPCVSHEIVTNGHYHVIEWILHHTPMQIQFDVKLSNKLCSDVALHGNIALLQFIRDQGCTSWTVETCANAAKNGHLELLQYARQHGCPWNWKTCANAALNGHLHVLQWAQQNGCPWSAATCQFAAENGHLEVIQWARNNNCKWNYKTCEYAAMNGHLHVLQWARDNGLKRWIDDKVDRLIKDGKNALHFASQRGNYEMVKYLIEECKASSFEVTEEGRWVPVHFACDSGHLKIVQYLVRKNSLCHDEDYVTSPGETLLHLACKKGHLQICQHLIEYGGACPYVSTLIDGDNGLDMACQNGYYKIAKYLVEKCNMEPSYTEIATKHGHTFLAEYISNADDEYQKNHSNRYPWRKMQL